MFSLLIHYDIYNYFEFFCKNYSNLKTSKQIICYLPFSGKELLIAESLDLGAGLQICSITHNNLNKPAPTWFLRARACFQSLEVGWVKRSATQRSKLNMG